MTTEFSTAPPDDARAIYRNTIRLMVFLHQGLDHSHAWRGVSREPTFAQFKALMMLRHLGTCGIKDLAAALGLSTSTMSEMVDRLVEQGLVDRRQDPTDRRRVRIELTHQAVKGVTRHEALIIRRLRSLMVDIGDDAAARWVEISDRIYSRIEAADRSRTKKTKG